MADTNIQLEEQETSKLDFFNTQLGEIETELRKHAAASEVLRNQAEKFMVEIRDKYGVNGQAMQYDPNTKQLIVIDQEPAVTEGEDAGG